MQNMLFLLFLITPALSVEYRVRITTASIVNSESIAVFYYTVVGTKGDTREFEADNDGDRRKGATDLW